MSEEQTEKPEEQSTGTEIASRSMTDMVDVDQMIVDINTKVHDKTSDNAIFIKAQNGIFTLPDGTEGDELRVVILNFITRHVYYDKPYTRGVVTPPRCWALSELDKGLEPDAENMKRMLNIEPLSDTCDDCQKFEWSSKALENPNVPETSKAKACDTQKLLAVVPAGSGSEAPVWCLMIPPNSLSRWNTYTGIVKRRFGDPIMVSTKITLDKKVNYNAFYFDDPHPNERIKEHVIRRDESLACLMIPPVSSQS